MENFLLLKEDYESLILEDEISQYLNEFKLCENDIYSFKKKSTIFNLLVSEPRFTKIQFFPNLQKKLSDYKLMVCDMDSTLIQNECIDEIADLINIKKEVSEITEMAMQGKLSFDESIKKRVMLLQGVDISSFEFIVKEKIRMQPFVHQWLKLVKSCGIETVIVSGGFSYFVNDVKDKLGFDHAFSNKLDVRSGKLTGSLKDRIINGEMKAEIVRDFKRKLNISSDEVITIGDGANDIEMFKESDLSISMHGKPILDKLVTWNVKNNYYQTLINLFKSE
jgi:phosphoserine phosphatase